MYIIGYIMVPETQQSILYVQRCWKQSKARGYNSPKKGIMFYLAEEEKTLSLENSVFI